METLSILRWRPVIAMLCIALSFVFAGASAASVLNRLEHALGQTDHHHLAFSALALGEGHHHVAPDHHDLHDHDDDDHDRDGHTHGGHGHSHYAEEPDETYAALVAVDHPDASVRSASSDHPIGPGHHHHSEAPTCALLAVVGLEAHSLSSNLRRPLKSDYAVRDPAVAGPERPPRS